MDALKKLGSAAAAAALLVALTGCGGTTDTGGTADNGGSTDNGSSTEEAIGGDIIAPVTMGVNDLQGAEVELLVGQVLNIDTESLDVDSYTGEVADPSIAEFTPGSADGNDAFNPGVTALAAGTTEVTMTNEQGGIQPLTFTVVVTERE
ncbi:MAG: hypothetical protein WDA07_09750 [Leucobacter sp.]